MQTARTSDAPQLIAAREIDLRPAAGRVHSIAAFVEAHQSCLSAHERAIVLQHGAELATDVHIPWKTPLVRNDTYACGRGQYAALASGARSAYVPALGMKLKGCRPENGTFPSWSVDAAGRVAVHQIPFGVLQPDNVMREILGYCFTQGNGLAPTSVPVAVMEYTAIDRDARYCLVSTGQREERVETRLDCDGMTLHRLLRLHASPARERLLGREVAIAGMNTAGYVADKIAALIRLHLGGGQRGILNSNIGNDVVRDNRFLGLCDFDTFAVRPLPAGREAAELREFVLRAFTEVIKSSLPFIDYLEVSSYRELKSYYIARSSVYAAYRKAFLSGAAERSWNVAEVERCIEDALECEVAFELFKELIPNSLTFKEFSCDSWYIAHG